MLEPKFIKRKVVTIVVDYNDGYDVPSDEYLREKVLESVGNGLLSSDEADTIVESWDVGVVTLLSHT